ncbi:hypothetical protein M5K25_014884 [Dendrobium thyrsiflorum]|uniref:Amino acid transporter transmembrane domain-containing protein n=1 Tax=Dendrobium thyrsiflorum TaxID=117978 RepID=A0ABD0UPH5_DENTH
MRIRNYWKIFLFRDAEWSTARTSLTRVIVGVDGNGSDKVWRTFQTLGDIAFAYSFSNVLIEIQLENSEVDARKKKILSHAFDILYVLRVIFPCDIQMQLGNSFVISMRIPSFNSFKLNFGSNLYHGILMAHNIKSSRKPGNGEDYLRWRKCITITTFFYMLCGVLGYTAFENDAPDNFLTGFGFYNPFWLIHIRNIFIAIHLISAYQDKSRTENSKFEQVFCQPIFQFEENLSQSRWPENSFLASECMINFQFLETI